jgi:hypothetical protein
MDDAGNLSFRETGVVNIVPSFGFYDCGNIGDKTMLNGFREPVSPMRIRAGISVESHNPAHIVQVASALPYFRENGRDPRRWWAKLRASARAILGGTPIMDLLGDWPLCKSTPTAQDENRMIHLSLQGQHSPAYWKGSECCHEKDSLSITVYLACAARLWRRGGAYGLKPADGQ